MRRVEVPLLREEAYGRLRQAIMDGELAPGQQLRPDDLAEVLGLSRMPIREALARLRAEGLVETRPRTGRQAGDIGPVKEDLPGGGLIEKTEQVHQRALARSRRPQYGDEFAVLDR